MAVYERESIVDAPLETVWAFHSRVDGLAALTPDWLHLECEHVEGPEDGTSERDATDRASAAGRIPDLELVEGTEVELSVQPFGVGPHQRWRSLVETRRREDSAAVFRDRMLEGPFDRWVHTHSFHDTGRRTRVRDHVTYELGEGAVSGVAGRFAVVGLAPTFRYRHRRLRSLLESGDWDGWD